MRVLSLLLAALVVVGCSESPVTMDAAKQSPRFQAVDVFVDSGGTPLAAYQVEAFYDPRRVQILGLEGGEREGFREAPHYDAAGMTGGRIIIAAFVDSDGKASAGRQRVARLHLRLADGAALLPVLKPMAAARPGGERMAIRVEVSPGKG